jgi:hypothetical protein
MRAAVIVAMSALLAGCGDVKKTFEDSFNKSFREKFISSCISSATESGVAQDMANRLCTCGADKVDQRYSVREKMSLKQEQLAPIVTECRAEAKG